MFRLRNIETSACAAWAYCLLVNPQGELVAQRTVLSLVLPSLLVVYRKVDEAASSLEPLVDLFYPFGRGVPLDSGELFPSALKHIVS